MSASEPQFLDVGEGAACRRIAYIVEPGVEPGVLWLQGFKSDMVSTKATALSEWARARGRACVRLDYSGHGQSGGRFEDGTIGRWLEEARAVLERCMTGSQIVVGSSMGGYLALLLLKRLIAEVPAQAARIKALMLIAPAWDMTEELMWKAFPDAVRHELMTTGVWLRPSQYGNPYPITRGLIEDGRSNLVGSAPWDPGRPIVIMHGRLDADVPFAHSERLIALLQGGHVRLVEVADGEHRLSRDEDIALMLRLIESCG